MSPEQARGDRVDTRVDVWAFGCVLYEMLTGKRAFEGATAPDVLAAILGGAPDLSRLPPGVPSAVRVLLRRCLARDVRQRIKSMNAVVLVLEEQDGLSAGPSSAVMPGARARRAARIVTGVVTIAAALAIGMWLARLTAPPPRIVRATIPADMYVAGTDRSFAFTPDGDRVVYISRDTSQILVHRMDGLEPISILKTASYLRGAFPSPDGQWLAFVENGFTLRKVSLAGGPATTILQMDGPSRGAAWGPDGTIVFATAASDTGLQQVAANGGPVTVLTRPDRARGEADHLQPVWLPGGRGLLFTIRPVNGDLNDSSVAVLDLQTQTWQTVVERGHAARYVGSGHLVYATTGALFAIPFDLSQRKTRGAPVEVLRPVVVNASGAVAQFDVAATARSRTHVTGASSTTTSCPCGSTGMAGRCQSQRRRAATGTRGFPRTAGAWRSSTAETSSSGRSTDPGRRRRGLLSRPVSTGSQSGRRAASALCSALGAAADSATCTSRNQAAPMRSV
jgi:serine/threonine-protein kinase